MHVQLQSLEILQAEKQSQLIENIQSAVTVLENSPGMFNYPSPSFNIDGASMDTTKVNVSPWGVYDVAQISSSHRNLCLTKIFLFSDNIRENKLLPSLYLSSKRYLSIGGKTYLGGNTYLPVRGIRKVNIGGIGYTREKLVFGDTYKSGSILPGLNIKWEGRYDLLEAIITKSTNKIQLEELKNDSISNSFSEQTQVIVCPAVRSVSNYYFEGNIILTGSKITFSNTTQLHNCIVYADTIIIKENFKGESQFFARNQIEIGTASVLKAPSVLYLNNSKKSDQIRLNSFSQFQGDIIIPNKSSEKESLIIEPNCHIIGQVYCNSYCTFAGTLFGSFYCYGFLEHNARGLYENYLIDVCIDVDRMPKEYSGISLIELPKAKSCNEELF